MEVRPVDPRTERSGSVYWPTYRVYFWKGTASDENQLLGAADVREVFAWADENCGVDRTYTVYVETDDGLGLIRLYGVDPTRLE